MTQLSIYVKGMIVLVTAASFFSLLLPSGDMQKYVRFATGLLMAVTFLLPFSRGDWKAIDILPPAAEGQAFQGPDHMIQQTYARQLEQHIKTKLGVEVQITLSDTMQVLQVTAKDEKTVQQVKHYLGIP